MVDRGIDDELRGDFCTGDQDRSMDNTSASRRSVANSMEMTIASASLTSVAGRISSVLNCSISTL